MKVCVQAKTPPQQHHELCRICEEFIQAEPSRFLQEEKSKKDEKKEKPRPQSGRGLANGWAGFALESRVLVYG